VASEARRLDREQRVEETRPPTPDRWLTVAGVADKFRTASVAVRVHAQQWADVRGVELQLLDLGFRRHQVTRHQDATVEIAEGHLDPFFSDGDDRGPVLGFALVVLLAVGGPPSVIAAGLPKLDSTSTSG
jgi:hypothetical protein